MNVQLKVLEAMSVTHYILSYVKATVLNVQLGSYVLLPERKVVWSYPMKPGADTDVGGHYLRQIKQCLWEVTVL